MGSAHYSAFDRTDLSSFDRTTTAKYGEKRKAPRLIQETA
jgi:hypothetical protein